MGGGSIRLQLNDVHIVSFSPGAMSRRRLARYLYAPAAVLIMGGCGGTDEMAPHHVNLAGTYTLIVFNGQPVPVPALTADTLFMLPDSTFTDRTYRNYPGLPWADTAWASGTYSVDPHAPANGVPGLSAVVTFGVTTSGNTGGNKRPTAGVFDGEVLYWDAANSQLGTNEGTSTPSLYQRRIVAGG